MNLGFLNRPTEMRGGSKTYNKNALRTFGRYSFPKGQTCHVAPLTDLDKGLEGLKLHWGKQAFVVCDEHYGLECLECAKPHSQFEDQNNFPSNYLAYVGYVIEYDGATRVSKKGKEYNLDPVAVILTQYTKDKTEIDKIKSANDEGEFLPNLWEYKRTESGKLIDPSMVSPTSKKLKQFDLTKIDEQREKFESKTQSEVWSLIFSALANVKLDSNELIEMGIHEITEEPAKDGLED